MNQILSCNPADLFFGDLKPHLVINGNIANEISCITKALS